MIIKESLKEEYKRIFRIFHIKYPKLIILSLIIILAYFIFSNKSSFVHSIFNDSYFSVILAGALFSFGFTTPLAVGAFLTMNPENIILSAILGGFFAMLSDIIIFKLVKFSFIDEFKKIENNFTIKKIEKLIKSNLPHKIRIYLLYAITGIIIASPLPDEIGITMLAGLSRVKEKNLAVISFIMNSTGILIMLLL